MSGRPFLDTNILVYALGEDRDRSPRVEALLVAGGVISVQVLNELAAVAHRKLKMSWAEVGEGLLAIRALCPTPLALTTDTHEEGLRLASAYGVHIYDALILASALQAGCAVLYSEDIQAGQVIDGRLRIENPFFMKS
jgi:predicted nucleic acid-binding protein